MKLYLIRSGSHINGMALWPFILINRRYKNKALPDHLIHHERIHHKQQLEMFIIPFYIWYITEYYIRYIRFRNKQQAYLNISFEREAYQQERQSDYLRHRPFWAFLKYL